MPNSPSVSYVRPWRGCPSGRYRSRALVPAGCRSGPRHDQVNQLVSASEAAPERGFMGRMMPLCSLPRSNPGNRHQYKRVNGPYKLIMIAGGDNKTPLRQPTASAGSGPGGAGRTGAGTSGLAACGGAHAMGAASAVAGEGARGTGETEQEELVRALRASRAAAGAAGERLPWSVGALPGLAGARWQTARDRWDDPGTHGKCWGAFGRSWSIGNAGSGFRWGKRIRKRCGRSKARQEESTAAGWKGQRNGRVRRRGGTDSQCITVIVAKTGTGSSARRRRERMEQVREIDGEQAYEKMRRAMEKADQEKARQVERSSKLPARKKPERREVR